MLTILSGEYANAVSAKNVSEAAGAPSASAATEQQASEVTRVTEPVPEATSMAHVEHGVQRSDGGIFDAAGAGGTIVGATASTTAAAL